MDCAWLRANCVLPSCSRPFRLGLLGQVCTVLGRLSVAGVSGLFHEGVGHAIGLAGEGDHAAVVDDAVDRCCCHVVVAEDLAPLGKREVGCDDQAALFVSVGDGLEQQSCPVGVDGDVSEFVDDEEYVFAQSCELFIEPACVFRVA